MASVQHFLCDADIFPLRIIQKHAALENVEKERHFAALKVQRVWRGYVVRKEIKRWHHAATVLQKYIRGYLLRRRLPAILSDYLDWYRLKYYNEMATKIQAVWRGYWVRRDRVPIKELLARRAAIQKANEEIQRQMREAFENMEKSRLAQMEKEAQQWVLYILFKLHHLLRTTTREGIYSIHGKTKLSCIEQLLKAIPLTEYMQELKKMYCQDVKTKKAPHTNYLYKSKHLQKIEDIYRSTIKKRNDEPRNIPCLGENIHDKPFNLNTKIPEKEYRRIALYIEEYTGRTFDFARTVDKSKHISKTDFNLDVLKNVQLEPKMPPYYIDFWTQLCEIHNIAL